MACFKVNIVRMNEAANQIEQVTQRLDGITECLRRTTSGRGISAASYWIIRNRINSMVHAIEGEKNKSAAMAATLSESVRLYGSCESMLSEGSMDWASGEEGDSGGDATDISEVLGVLDWSVIPFIRQLGPGGNPFSSWLDGLLADVQEEKDTLSVVKLLLKGSDEWGNIGEAGILENMISYIEDYSAFFTGDKKGLTGASDWMNLADSSVGVWKEIYDYYYDMYEGVKTGFFGEVAKKNVKILGLSADFLGLTSSFLSASNGLDEKKWQSIVGDYIDCGKDIFLVAKSGYELKHIGDVKSLANIKAGPWSALDVYGAVINAGIQTVSQGFRSHEKYSADGQWDMGDTGATGIDISMAGVYGLSHSLTLGLDDLVFGVIDNATGGNGTDDMSYYEKAAEGYKILANECGDAIANWWTSLFK